jgi:hypothetical protein
MLAETEAGRSAWEGNFGQGGGLSRTLKRCPSVVRQLNVDPIAFRRRHNPPKLSQASTIEWLTPRAGSHKSESPSAKLRMSRIAGVMFCAVIVSPFLVMARGQLRRQSC